MHRSGTSFVAGSFVRGGYFVGKDESLVSPSADNPDGFFERTDVLNVNNRILSELGAAWWRPPSLDLVVADQARLGGLVSETFAAVLAQAAGAPVVLKDPRMASLMPVWDSVLGQQFVDVLVLRNPMDIARSLMRRNGFPLQYSLALWEIHLCGILRSLAGRPICSLNFSRIESAERMASGLGEIGRVLELAGLPPLDPSLFDPANRHFAGPESDLLLLGTPSQLRLWRYLAGLSAVETALVVPHDLFSPSAASTNLVVEVGRLIGEPAFLLPPKNPDAADSDESPSKIESPPPEVTRSDGRLDAYKSLLRSTVNAWQTTEQRAARAESETAGLVNDLRVAEEQNDRLLRDLDSFRRQVVASGEAQRNLRSQLAFAEQRVDALIAALACARQQGQTLGSGAPAPAVPSSAPASRSSRITRVLRWVMYRVRGCRSTLPSH